MKPELKEWIWLANLQGIITRKKVELLRFFDSPAKIFQADSVALAQTGILSRDNINAILSPAPRVAVNQTMEKLEQQRIQVVTLDDDNYPHLLKNIVDPPVCLYVKGNLLNDGHLWGSRITKGIRVWCSIAKKILIRVIPIHTVLPVAWPGVLILRRILVHCQLAAEPSRYLAAGWILFIHPKTGT